LHFWQDYAKLAGVISTSFYLLRWLARPEHFSYRPGISDAPFPFDFKTPGQQIQPQEFGTCFGRLPDEGANATSFSWPQLERLAMPRAPPFADPLSR
jgi:hypothetical protein